MILVVGATGDLGARVVAALAAAGSSLRALVRPSTDAGALEASGVEVVRGDLTDPASLGSACVGVGTVVSGATAIGRLLSGRGGPTIDAVDRDGTLALVDAAERAGVERFVYVSHASPDDSQGSPIERAKAAVEDRLWRSDLQRVLVRPDAYHEVHLSPLARFDLAAGRIGVLGRGDSPRRWVATADVARLVAALAREPDPPELVEVGGPELHTRNELVQLAAELTGRRMRRQALPRAVVRAIMLATARARPEVSSVMGLGLMMDLHGARWDDGPLRQRGIEPRSTTQFLTEQASALRA